MNTWIRLRLNTFGFDKVGEKNNFISIRGTCIDCSQILFLRYADQMRARDLPAKSGRDLIARFLFCFVWFWNHIPPCGGVVCEDSLSRKSKYHWRMKINATTFTVRFVRIICKEWVGTWEKRITRTQFESFRQNANASRDKKVEEFSMVLTLKLLLFFVCSGLYLFCGIWPVYSCPLPSCFGQIIGNCAMLLGRIRRTKS